MLRKRLIGTEESSIFPKAHAFRQVSVLHDMSMLTLITHKKDSVTVLKESCAAFEETSAAVYQFTRVFSQLGGCALYSGLRSLESAWLGCVERFTGKAFLAKPVQSKLEMVSHGASNVNVTFVLPGDQLLMASQRLHKVFFEKAATKTMNEDVVS